MLRYERRWHDAANSPPIDGEARLLWFAKSPASPSAPDPDDDDAPEEGLDENGRGRERQQRPNEQDDGEHQQQARLSALGEYNRRTAYEVLEDGAEIDVDEIPKTSDLVASVQGLKQTLDDVNANLTAMELRPGGAKNGVVQNFRRGLDKLKRRTTDHNFTLEGLHLDAWEEGTMTPTEFLRRYTSFVENMKFLDERNTDLTATERASRDKSRNLLLGETRTAVERALQRKPAAMPTKVLQQVADRPITDEEIWRLYSEHEKDDIMKDINQAAGIDHLKMNIQDDVDSIREILERQNIVDRLLEEERSMMQDTSMHHGDYGEESVDTVHGGPKHLWTTAIATWTKFNEAAGIEWMTAYEWAEAFKEVWSAIEELRKQKSRLRISRAATRIGHAAALVPGLGGQDLEHILDEQQQHKNDEIKDAYVKELKNNKVDLGFRQLFGEAGKSGLLHHYALIGDTNRTRAILEFAAGKGLLYDIKGLEEYEIPGGLRVNDVLPKEWTREQKSTYWDNIGFMNTQGQAAQEKAGEDFTKGRPQLKDYLEPFEGSLKSMSLWFAKGIANKALSKVKNGEASALLTLIVLDAWKTNPLFRKYVPAEWMDRLAGDSKQLLIGMIKYDQKQLLEGARGDTYRTTELAEMKGLPFEPGGPPNNGRLGPLVAAVENEIKRLDDSVAPKQGDDASQKKFRLLTAQVLACKMVKLPNGKQVSLYSPRLRPYHIKYNPDEMRDANVSALGDDFFIEQSEITHCTAEVMQYIGRVTQEGFAEPTKARYFFSHIITSYGNLETLARTSPTQKEEFQVALRNFVTKQRTNLDQWIERAIQGNGGMKLLTEKHKDQKGRRLVFTMLKHGLISLSVIQKVASIKGVNGEAARQLLRQYDASSGSIEHVSVQTKRRTQALESAEADFKTAT